LWFDKFIPHIRPGVILIGHSLGGLFLAKYLSKNKFPKKILATFLIGACYSEGDFTAPKDVKLFKKQGGKIFLYHSKDDSIVPFSDFEKYKEKLPSAICRIFDDQWHFVGETVPGLARDIKNTH
jgi:predicted alpha/beta hydrolase family esterase